MSNYNCTEPVLYMFWVVFLMFFLVQPTTYSKLFRGILKQCFSVHRKCFVDFETSTDFPSTWG